MNIKNYWEPTPVLMRKIGDTILYMSGLLIVAIGQMPITDLQAKWAVSITGIVGILGKGVTNFFKEENKTNV